jgi:hypothetical protein
LNELILNEDKKPISKHKCQDYCGVCNPIRALEILSHRAIVKGREIKVKLIKDEQAIKRARAKS